MTNIHDYRLALRHEKIAGGAFARLRSWGTYLCTQLTAPIGPLHASAGEGTAGVHRKLVRTTGTWYNEH